MASDEFRSVQLPTTSADECEIYPISPLTNAPSPCPSNALTRIPRKITQNEKQPSIRASNLPPINPRRIRKATPRPQHNTRITTSRLRKYSQQTMRINLASRHGLNPCGEGRAAGGADGEDVVGPAGEGVLGVLAVPGGAGFEFDEDTAGGVFVGAGGDGCGVGEGEGGEGGEGGEEDGIEHFGGWAVDLRRWLGCEDGKPRD
ncbi:hypothetical protein B0T14DRAFT_524087 [Immersiella caudata]|uniref:Uncharacterized protein n=1 Tax=Immersiella caudata TaxID=314043 RepID=A0AA39WK94_9PEZI|nr:hypothetical protein B0T14DRAFT_524087 [Immersiella caudata]